MQALYFGLNRKMRRLDAKGQIGDEVFLEILRPRLTLEPRFISALHTFISSSRIFCVKHSDILISVNMPSSLSASMQKSSFLHLTVSGIHRKYLNCYIGSIILIEKSVSHCISITPSYCSTTVFIFCSPTP